MLIRSLVCALVVLPGLAHADKVRLRDCLRLALQHHPQLGISSARVEQAEAERLLSRSGYWPQLAISAASSWSYFGHQDATYVDGTRIADAQEPYDQSWHHLGVTWKQKIFDGGRQWYRIARANHEHQRARLEQQATRQRLALEVIEGFFELLKQRRHLEVLQLSLEVSKEQLRIARERHHIGSLSLVDVSRTQVSEGEDRISLARQQARVRAAAVRLNLRMGREPGAPLDPRPPADRAVATAHGLDRTIGGPGGGVLTEQAQLAAARAAQAVAESETSLAKAGHWPTLAAVLQYERQHPGLADLYSRFDELYAVRGLVQFSLPIFAGFSTTAQTRAAEAKARQLAAGASLLRQQLDAQLVATRHELVALQEAASIGLTNIEVAERSLTLAQERYALGQGTVIELRDAQLALNRARLLQAEARFDAQIAVANYHYAKGDLLSTYLPASKR